MLIITESSEMDTDQSEDESNYVRIIFWSLNLIEKIIKFFH